MATASATRVRTRDRLVLDPVSWQDYTSFLELFADRPAWRLTYDRSVLEITIREGRNRQVRRMLAGMGHKVRDLTRIRMGPLTLQGLGMGQFRHLSAKEISQLRASSRGPDIDDHRSHPPESAARA